MNANETQEFIALPVRLELARVAREEAAVDRLLEQLREDFGEDLSTGFELL